MEQETIEQFATQDETRRDNAVIAPQGQVVGTPPRDDMPCQSCAASAFSHVYAIGRMEAHFPSRAIEKEFVQTTGRAETAGQTDQQVFYNVLSKPENRYLARQMCWVLTIQGLETYIVQPRDVQGFRSVGRSDPSATEPYGFRCRDWYARTHRSTGVL